VKLISALKENDLFEHPRGGLSFGVIPEIPHLKLPEGNIYLRRGAHDAGQDRGFGVEHIWAVHEHELKSKGFRIIEDVASYIAHIIQPGTPVYFEAQQPQKRNTRGGVLRSSFGLVIVEARHERTGFGYFVVTAYSKRSAKGTLVCVTK